MLLYSMRRENRMVCASQFYGRGSQQNARLGSKCKLTNPRGFVTGARGQSQRIGGCEAEKEQILVRIACEYPGPSHTNETGRPSLPSSAAIVGMAMAGSHFSPFSFKPYWQDPGWTPVKACDHRAALRSFCNKKKGTHGCQRA
jgi:hypothetical protein